VVAGVTTTEPDVGIAPIPEDRVALIALVEVNESVAEPPAEIEVGFAASVQVGLGRGAVTVTLVVAVVVPALLTAVRVYTVVTVGVTTFVDLKTAPTP
jgi:hypothetical protein